MQRPLRIDIVSDVVCPWCIIGFKQLQHALEEIGGEQQIDLHWHPFELNPHMPQEGQNLRQHLGQKYGTTLEQSQAARQRLTQIGEELGFDFRYYDEMRIYNTFQAHQLLHWASEAGKQTELKLALFEAYFTRQEDVSDGNVLQTVAERAGLDRAQAKAVLHNGRYREMVRREEQDWLNRGIHGVPASIFDDRYLVSGARGQEFFVGVLKDLLSEKAA